MKKNLIRATLAACVLAVCALAAFVLVLHGYAKTPACPGGPNVTVLIRKGQDFEETARLMAARGLVRHPLWFSVVARATRRDHLVRAGEYWVSCSMTPLGILHELAFGRPVLHRLTVVEGANLAAIALAVEKAGFGSREEFLAKATDPASASRLSPDAKTLEGYLFPDTYFFERDARPEDIVLAMTRRFFRVFTKEMQDRAIFMGLTVHQAVTLASIIEKESGSREEYPAISSVFHNRLEKGMKLESDPTVIYGIKDFDGNLTREHLTTQTPYNTYVIPGFPPGPIASPGQEALCAALYPARTPYLYFVSKQDGTHYFSTTLAEHNRAVRKYQLKQDPGKQPQTRKKT